MQKTVDRYREVGYHISMTYMTVSLVDLPGGKNGNTKTLPVGSIVEVLTVDKGSPFPYSTILLHDGREFNVADSLESIVERTFWTVRETEEK